MCYLIVCSGRQPSTNEDLLLKQAQDGEKVFKILIVFDSNVWDQYEEEKVCGGHMPANLRWSWLNYIFSFVAISRLLILQLFICNDIKW